MEKQIRIQEGVVKRLRKEVEYYEKEEGVQRGVVERMKVEGADEADIRMQERVLGETLMMIPDSKERLERAEEEYAILLSKE